MILRVGKWYRTRCGYQVKVVATIRKAKDYKYIAECYNHDDSSFKLTYTKDGQYRRDDFYNKFDLIREVK